jgi:hypothetical protein
MKLVPSFTAIANASYLPVETTGATTSSVSDTGSRVSPLAINKVE